MFCSESTLSDLPGHTYLELSVDVGHGQADYPRVVDHVVEVHDEVFAGWHVEQAVYLFQIRNKV